MIDVSDVLARLGDQSLTWDEEVAVEIADDLARSVGGVVDWDDEAGEEWLSVLLRDARVAMVSTTLRLIVAVERMSGEVQVVARGETAILVPSFDAPVMQCEIEVLGRTFGEEDRFRELGLGIFSANDLWFATV
ncbi:hypothetical protein OG613_06090 [Streptomyces sp. NBC_00015]|uniref:hypothetical protein n=1 Tax=unclassified Streptomyces TaxID=2593676 RepID=UPI0022597324|nr:hypothetical protein [Streptomyces sp. NBC_00103]MCX5374765.1 hypothetical protein [Streptomyces sp. NBC_00103]